MDAAAALARLSGALPLDDLANGARLVAGLPAFLRQPLTLDSARRSLAVRLERREAALLEVVRLLYVSQASPYRRLLAAAGCEWGDLERLVRQEGLEAALRDLAGRGVYLTVDEMKGRRAVVRGSLTLQVQPEQLRNPRLRTLTVASTSGSRGPATTVLLSLPHVRDRTVNTVVPLALRGGSAWQKAVWGVPGGSLNTLLQYALLGRAPTRWFVQVASDAPGLHPRYRWSARALRWTSVLSGRPLPGPRHVSLDDPTPIARWMADLLRRGETPHLDSFSSPVVRLCEAAAAAGLSLVGAQFTTAGEALTAARAATIRKIGAEVVPRYSIAETGPIGYGCLLPSAPDDMHLLEDCHALVQLAEPGPPNLPPEAVLLTSLRANAPIVLLNASFGDQALLEPSACGCPLERFGWRTHLREVRSFEKLTTGGMTFLNTDVIRVLEESLPARFGGGPTDYQLVEDEDAQGRPLLTLLVNPTIGAVEETTVREAFLAALGSGSGAQRVMVLQWRDLGLPRLERRAPLPTARGKILHLHLARQADQSPVPSGGADR